MERLEKQSAAVPAQTEPSAEGAPAVTRERRRLLKNRAVRTQKIVILKSGVDRPFLIIVILLLCLGTTMVFSSSYAYAKYNFQGDSYHFAKRQIVWVGISLAVMFVTSKLLPLRLIERFSKLTLYVAVALLALVLVPHVGKTVNGAVRWIEIGPIQIQPSEIAKLAVVLFFSKHCVQHQKDMKRFKEGVLPFGIAAVVIGALLYKEPHLSAMIIILVLIFCMMYLGGTRKLYLAIIGIAGVAGMIFLMLGTSHGKERITNWLHPELDPTGKGWQPLQSLYAIGSGGVWGKGLGQSTQKHLWLPEPQNDYIFAILCEEMGFVFAAAVMILFAVLIWRGFYIARHASTQFNTLVVLGLTIQIAVQILLNIAVVTNSIPSTGVSLPFFSYGGSALVIIMAEMGIILNISRYSLIEKS